MKKNSGATFRTRHNSPRQTTASDEPIGHDDNDDESVGSSSLSRRRDQRDRMAFTNAALFSEATTSAVRAGSSAAPSSAVLMASSSATGVSTPASPHGPTNASASSTSGGTNPAAPAKLVSILSSTGIDDISYNEDGTPRPSSSRKGGGTKKVSWVEGVAESKSANLAVSIPRHKVKDGDHVIYIIELYRSGRSWTIRKRYSEFCRLHEALMAEGVVAPILLPKLPSKRWFRWVRWSNRFEERATTQRRQQLQEYLRTLIRWDDLVKNSRILQKFLEANHSLAIDDDNEDHVGLDDDGIERNSFYYEQHPVMEEEG